MERLGPLAAAVDGHGRPTSSTGKAVDADLGARPHALAGRPDRDRRPARLARRRPPRCSPTASGSTRSPTTAAADGLTHVVVMGMGGSSLFPEVLARTFPPPAGGPSSRVLDTTDPAAVARIGHECPDDATLFLAVVEVGLDDRDPQPPRALLGPHRPARAVRGRHRPRLRAGDAGRRARLPGHLREPARHRRSLLGAVVLRPGAGGARRRRLAGLLGAADRHGRAPRTRRRPGRRTPALRLGADPRRGGAGRPRQAHPRPRPATSRRFGLWLEQLVAESTGKQGTGRDPDRRRAARPARGLRRRPALRRHRRATTASTPLADAGHPVVELGLRRPARPRRPGAAVGGRHRRVRRRARHQPVRPAQRGRGQGGHRRPCSHGDEPPDIAERAARRRCSTRCGRATTSPSRPTSTPRPASVDALEDARTAIRDRLRVATTVGLGPRFLHSTGQLHKGGPPTGVFVQVVGDDPDGRRRSPARPSRSRTLKQAQAAGDLLTLRRRGLRAARVALDDLVEVTR